MVSQPGGGPAETVSRPADRFPGDGFWEPARALRFRRSYSFRGTSFERQVAFRGIVSAVTLDRGARIRRLLWFATPVLAANLRLGYRIMTG